jgi:hypothetical protein
MTIPASRYRRAERLTPIERFRLAVSHRQPDRPPIQVYLTDQMRRKLAGHVERRTGSRAVLPALECESGEECRAEAAERIRVIGAKDGYIFGPAHNIQSDAPLANVLAIYETATGRDLGAADCGGGR